ncbi:hypothetical protein GA417_05555 [Poseidonibacter ostreae]|uniref:hypothetical protein n=1 Tax=Poseidonibacter ostreae TaxID=2654171 RepID=UPI0012648BCB|nr:hypothetical protein [Poseidonibacter ostreae]KAB7886416.1 hypothetical protein GA417_05555 [Poseidonibacter ostreae]
MNEKNIHKELLKLTEEIPKLNNIIKQNNILYIPKIKLELFDYMCFIIVKQQLSNKAADSIWKRILIKTNENIFDFLQNQDSSELLLCGISRRKLEALKRLSETHKEEDINNIKSFSIEKTQKYILSLYGFGTWSADMICLFYLKNPDIWSNNDATLSKVSNLLNIDESTITKCSPYRSFLALHFWKAIDDKQI